MDKNVVTRFAVSPTGFMHIGGVRTALFSYLWARKNNGTFILRIEDTDKKREVDGAVDHIKDSLAWLGIEWDYGPDTPGPWGSNTQSERLDIYKAYAQKLIEKGYAYPDPYTVEETEAFKQQAESEKRPYLYRDHRPENPGEWDGTQPLRLKVPEIKRYEWHDAVRGNLSAGPEMLDDIVLIKSDGFPTYNFCHIVDDIEMGVTHVMRSDEFISSMPKFLSIYDALGVAWPIFAVLPPIMNDMGNKKLSKRDGAKDVVEYRAEGYLPETMINFLALIGWNPGTDQEVFTPTELQAAFTIEGIQKSGGSFNPEKLLWMNKQHLSTVSDDAFLAALPHWLPKHITTAPQYEERISKLLPVIRERVDVYQHIKDAAAEGEYDWVFTDIEFGTELLKWKKDPAVAEVKPRLIHALTLLTEADFSDPETIKSALWDYAEATGKGEVLWPIRVALTGRERSPDPFQCAYILGQAETLIRIQSACDKIG